MDNYDEEVVAETTTEETAPESVETTEQPEQETVKETTEEVDWKERALKAERAIEKAKAKGKNEPKTEKSNSPDEVVAARLEARGILHADDQAYVLKYAKVEGVHYLEALEDDFVKDALDRKKKARLSASAAPKGNNRAPGDMNDVASAVKKFDKDGSLPDNPALVAKVLKAIKNR